MGDDPMALLGLEGALKHYYIIIIIIIIMYKGLGRVQQCVRMRMSLVTKQST
jgi:hypothetical protein